MYTEDGIMGSLVMVGIPVIGTVDGMQDIGAVFAHGDLIIGIIHTGATAVIGAQTLTGDGVMPTTTHGFITVLDGDITAITALGISTIMAIPLLRTEGAQIKIDWFQEAAQIAQI